MKKNKIIIIYSSHLPLEVDKKFESNIRNTIGVKNYEIHRYENHNQYSLPEVYNRAINEHRDENAVFVFAHNDIILRTSNWGKILLSRFNSTNFSILGVAGTSYLPDSGRWWDDRSKMIGIVDHTDGIREWTSEYSPPFRGVRDVVLIDGLFMAVDVESIEHQFDEDFKGFHMYDISLCIPNYLDGVDIGVLTDIRVLHKSVGETNNQWEENRIQFVEKFKDELPIKIIPEDKLRILICCQFFQNYTGSEVSNYELAKELKKLGNEVTLVSTMVGEPLLSKAKSVGIDVRHISNAPNYQVNGEGQLQFIKNEKEFDILHINHKPIGEMVLKMYPNTPAVMNVSSEDIPTFEEPIIHSQIKKYLSLGDSVREHIKTFGITDNKIIEIINPDNITKKSLDIYNKILDGDYETEDKKSVKILTGWSNKGGSTFALIRLTNVLNDVGYETTLYGPHKWHLDKCKSGLLKDYIPESDDRIITHFLKFNDRLSAKKIILACHEKDVFKVGEVNQYWDVAVFLNEKQRKYHEKYNGAYNIIPNLKESLLKNKKSVDVERVAGIIGSIDENKQTHLSINRALNDGFDKIYLFGTVNDPHYYNEKVKPLINDKIIEYGFIENKQMMYDMVSTVYLSSKSEVASLVKDECEATGTIFKGNSATTHDGQSMSNDEIIKKWIEILELW